jgi:4-hydroxy-tetrahydrodipicolinate reductase
VQRAGERAVTGGLVPVAKGRVSGVNQRAVGYVDGTPRITLTLEAYLGAPESYDSVLIEGSPRIYSKIEGGVHGDIATASMTVNSFAAVIEASRGFRTLRDLWLPYFFGGE